MISTIKISTKDLPRNEHTSIMYVPGSYFVMLQTLFYIEKVQYHRIPRSQMNDIDCEIWVKKFQSIKPSTRIQSMVAIETNLTPDDIFNLCITYTNDKESQKFINAQHCTITDTDFIPWTDNK